MLHNNSEFNSVGGVSGFGSGGGIPAFGLFGLTGHRDHGHGHDHKRHDDCAKDLLLMKSVGDLKDTIANAKDAVSDRVEDTKDAITSRVESAKDVLVNEARSLDKEICDTKSAVKDGFYQLAIQAERNTSEIKNQAQLNHLDNDRKFDALSREGERNTALILAKLNQTELDNLRDQLHGERRRGDSREIEVNIANTNTNVLTAIQSIRNENDRKFDVLFNSFNQLNRNTQDIINFGTMKESGNQANQQTNVK